MSAGDKLIQTLWIFDFDGTLSEIVPDRQRAVLHPACIDMLTNLTNSESDQVGILSSRRLEDLLPRIPFRNVLLAASCGLEIRLADGDIITPSKKVFLEVDIVRTEIMPIIQSLQIGFPKIEVEDKRWSIVLHYRNVPSEDRERMRLMISSLSSIRGIQLFEGPEATEIMMLPQLSKLSGIRKIVRLLEVNPRKTNLIFAGDDANDAEAMKWVLDKGGTSFVVGNRISVIGTKRVDGPAALVDAVVKVRRSLQNQGSRQ